MKLLQQSGVCSATAGKINRRGNTNSTAYLGVSGC